MSSLGRLREFVNRNLIFIVCIPGVGLAQYGWYKLQDNETFVRMDERKEFPAITVSDSPLALGGILGPNGTLTST
jgi:hypothetical protein